MTGMSRRAYARSRDIDESTVRKHIRSGALADAILPDGTIDPVKADAALRDGRTRGKVVPAHLTAAKARRERALAMRDMHELHKIRRDHIRPDDAAEDLEEIRQLLASVFRRLPARLAARVVGENARTINTLVKDAVNELLGEAHEAIQHGMAAKLQKFDALPKEEPPPIDAMTPVELAAHRATVQAEIHERTLAIEIGVLRPYAELLLLSDETVALVKSRLWALPGRLTVPLEHADQVAAEKLIGAEIEEIIALMDEPVRRLRAMQPQKAA